METQVMVIENNYITLVQSNFNLFSLRQEHHHKERVTPCCSYLTFKRQQGVPLQIKKVAKIVVTILKNK